MVIMAVWCVMKIELRCCSFDCRNIVFSIFNSLYHSCTIKDLETLIRCSFDEHRLFLSFWMELCLDIEALAGCANRRSIYIRALLPTFVSDDYPTSSDIFLLLCEAIIAGPGSVILLRNWVCSSLRVSLQTTFMFIPALNTSKI